MDGVDDANMFGVTEVRQEVLTTKHSCLTVLSYIHSNRSISFEFPALCRGKGSNLGYL